VLVVAAVPETAASACGGHLGRGERNGAVCAISSREI
jgi:hypothetical protein